MRAVFTAHGTVLHLDGEGILCHGSSDVRLEEIADAYAVVCGAGTRMQDQGLKIIEHSDGTRSLFKQGVYGCAEPDRVAIQFDRPARALWETFSIADLPGSNFDAVTRHVIGATRSRVYGGPFAGMFLSPGSVWSPADLPSRHLGTYEQELHEHLLRLKGKNFDCVIDIGCADGYYAVGLALLYKSAKVFAFDTNVEARALCVRNARANRVEDRLTPGGLCDGAELRRLCVAHDRPFIFCDCEGCEVELFSDSGTIAALSQADLVIEMHEFIHPSCTQNLARMFAATHDVVEVRQSARDPNAFPMLTHLPDFDRWRAICEFRPSIMNWLIVERR